MVEILKYIKIENYILKQVKYKYDIQWEIYCNDILCGVFTSKSLALNYLYNYLIKS